MQELFQQYQNYILSTVALVIIALLAKMESVKSFISTMWVSIQGIASFVGDAFRETGGKTSITRLIGAYSVFKIFNQFGNIPTEWVWVFNVCIGYQALSIIVKDNPMIEKFIIAKYGVDVPKEEKKPTDTI